MRASSAGLVGIFASKYGQGGEKLNLQTPYVIFKIGNMWTYLHTEELEEKPRVVQKAEG